MEKPIDFKQVAAQLANPSGEMGRTIAKNMNRSNGDMTRRTVDMLGIQTGEAVLEIGPGNGALATYVRDKAWGVRYMGADISPTMVEEATRIHREAIADGRMAFSLVDGTALPFRDAAFDKVFTVNTLYFWEEPELQLSEIRRVLRPTGIFCLAIASKAFMETLPFSPYGFRLYSPEEASQLLANNGFTIAQRAIGHYGTTGQSGAVLREEITILARID